MTQSEKQHTTGPGNAGPDPDAFDPKQRPEDIAPNDQSWLQLSKDAAALVQGFCQLAVLELALTLKTIPKALATGVTAVFFLVWAWLSMCVVAGWAAYLLSGWSILAPITFFAMQLLGIAVCVIQLKKAKTQMGLPHTRKQWQELKGALHGPGPRDQ